MKTAKEVAKTVIGIFLFMVVLGSCNGVFAGESCVFLWGCA